jgi:hypothetical protein
MVKKPFKLDGSFLIVPDAPGSVRMQLHVDRSVVDQ